MKNKKTQIKEHLKSSRFHLQRTLIATELDHLGKLMAKMVLQSQSHLLQRKMHLLVLKIYWLLLSAIRMGVPF